MPRGEEIVLMYVLFINSMLQMDKETGTERLGNVSKVTQLISRGARI